MWNTIGEVIGIVIFIGILILIWVLLEVGYP